MNTAKFFAILAAAFLAIQGCQSEIIEYGSIDTDTDIAPGYIDLSAFSLSVSKYAEEITLSSTQNPAQSSAQAVATNPSSAQTIATSRAQQADPQTKTDTPLAVDAPEDYIVRFRNIKTAEEATYTYGQIKALPDAKLELTPGTYVISAESPDYKTYMETGPEAQWDMPVYFVQTTKTVVTRQNTQVGELICRLANIKATVSLTPDLAGLFRSDAECESIDGAVKLAVRISVDKNELVYDSQKMNAVSEGFFKAAEQGRTLEIVLTGDYNKAAADQPAEYTTITWRASIPGCMAGQWRRISIGLENATDGNVRFNLTVENWTYNETIDVDVMKVLATAKFEEFLVDGDFTDEGSPVFALSGGDIADGYILHSGLYDPILGKWLENMRLTLTPTEGSEVAKAYFEVSTDNSELSSDIAAAYPNGQIPLWPANSALSQYIVPVQADNSISYILSDSGMTALFAYKGTHVLKLVAEDSEWRTSYTDFTVTCLEGEVVMSAPELVWTNVAGDFIYDFSQRYPHKTAEIVLTATTENAFTDFVVDIDSDLLTEELLTGVGLGAHLDLINPGTSETMLGSLGFPLKDEITSVKEVNFNITSFMSMISVLGTDGYCDFTITVTDESGTTSKTIQLDVVE